MSTSFIHGFKLVQLIDWCTEMWRKCTISDKEESPTKSEMCDVSVDSLRGEKWRDIRRLTDRKSEFAPEYFEPGPENLSMVHECRVLVIGAGGLGCELLKNLALSGFQSIDVIDMDTIDLSNLNRQFLFRESDVGKSKSEVAAAFMERRVPGCRITAHNCPIQSKPPSFYRQFRIVVCGLDSIKARRWINNMLCDLVEYPDGEMDMSTIIPMIDGGTEGFKGNARVIYPRMSPCVECVLDLYPPQINFPLCTIAHTPRLPEHCVEYIKVAQWDELKPFDGAQLDADDPSHVDWVFEQAKERAEKFGIRGVDRRLTQGVLKRIIPAVASTNAVIAASCALEALKLASNISIPINNYLNFADVEGVYCGVVKLEMNCYGKYCSCRAKLRSHPFPCRKCRARFKPNCAACSGKSVPVEVAPEACFEVLVEKLKDQFQLINPTLKTSTVTLYEISDFFPEAKEQSEKNLLRRVDELLASGEEMLITDEVLTRAMNVQIQLVNNTDN